MSGLLDGRIALVTGASSGIGAATALGLAKAGASVALSARRADRLAELVARIEADGGRAIALPGDVVDEAVARDAVARTIETFGRIDILVNSAGIIQASKIENADLAEYRRVLEVNLFATVNACTAAIPAMKAQGAGDIINISSQAARKAAAVFNSYSASKYALNAMTDAMRQEVAGFGIRVAALMPGATQTEVFQNVSDPGYRKMMEAHVTKADAVPASDIADAIVFMVALPRGTNVDLISIRPTGDVN